MRVPYPWYRAFNNTWYVELNSKQHPLGKHPERCRSPKRPEKGERWSPPKEILDAFHKLMAAEGEKPAPPPKPVAIVTVEWLCEQFLAFAARYNTPGEYKNCNAFLQSLSDTHGKLLARDLTETHVGEWLDGQPTWKGARRHAVIALKRAYNWAERARLVVPNPIKGLKNTRAVSRARFLSADQRKKVLAEIPDWQFRFFVEALQESGCRPSEVRRVEAKDVDLTLGIWRLEKHKNAKRTGKKRIVYLTPRLLDITKELMQKNPEGALFRGPRFNRAFGMHGVITRFRRLRTRLRKKYPKKKFPKLDFDAVCGYAYRHSAASDALKNGVPIAQTAVLLGTSPDMIHHHYSHLADDIEHMRGMAKKATGA